MSDEPQPRSDASRLEVLLRVVERLAAGDFQVEIPVQGTRDEIDAIAAGLDILLGELRNTTVSKQYIDAVIDSMADLLIVVDRAGRIRRVNTSAARALGIPAERLIDRHLSVVIDTIGPLELDRRLREIVAGRGSFEGPVQLRAGTGEAIPVELRASVVAQPLERGEDVLLVARDMREIQRLVAERDGLERQLHQSQRMEAMGRLAGGIAHDFNNLLTAMVSYGELLADSLDPGDDRRQDVDGILQAAHRAEVLVRQLLAFSRRQPTAPGTVEVNALLAEMERMLVRILGEDIQLVVQPSVTEVEVGLGGVQLEQVLMNLVVNARDAMEHGGTLRLQAARDEDDLSMVRLVVEDDGMGMSPEIQNQIFEPFFTTKTTGKGSGLGLSTCYGIVTQAGGTIEVHSETGRGSRFVVRVPIASGRGDPRKEEETAEMPVATVRGTETILLVEDETAVRNLVERTLRTLGYMVIPARDGVEALGELGRAGPETVDLMLTDVVMPRMGGIELAQQVQRIRPTIKILYMSGHTGDSGPGRALLRSRALLPKPFTPHGLAQRVRRMLDEGE